MKRLPALTSKLENITYSIRRQYVDEFHLCYVPEIPSSSLVLDLGGNKINKRGKFNIERYSVKVIYTDLSTIKRPDVQSNASLLPFDSNSFDAIVCSEVLEHVPDPRKVLDEAQRVLKSDGLFLMCVPFMFRIHSDPYDFGRYTDFYWHQELQKAGLRVISIEKQGLFWSVFVEMIRSWVYQKMLDGKLIQKWRISLASFIIAWARKRALHHDLANRAHPFYSSYTTGFGIVARKQETG